MERYDPQAIEAKWQDPRVDGVDTLANTSDATKTRGVWVVGQIGYAMTQWVDTSGVLVEPAFRFSYLNADTKNDDEQTVLGIEGADANSSGYAFDVGANLYFNGHNNKLQIALQHWDAEAGEGKADLVRVQHQIWF